MPATLNGKICPENDRKKKAQHERELFPVLIGYDKRYAVSINHSFCFRSLDRQMGNFFAEAWTPVSLTSWYRGPRQRWGKCGAVHPTSLHLVSESRHVTHGLCSLKLEELTTSSANLASSSAASVGIGSATSMGTSWRPPLSAALYDISGLVPPRHQQRRCRDGIVDVHLHLQTYSKIFTQPHTNTQLSAVRTT